MSRESCSTIVRHQGPVLRWPVSFPKPERRRRLPLDGAPHLHGVGDPAEAAQDGPHQNGALAPQVIAPAGTGSVTQRTFHTAPGLQSSWGCWGVAHKAWEAKTWRGGREERKGAREKRGKKKEKKKGGKKRKRGQKREWKDDGRGKSRGKRENETSDERDEDEGG